MHSCQNCSQLFIPGPGSTGKYCSLHCAKKAIGKAKKEKNFQNYLLNPKKCKNCHTPIEFKHRKINLFCSRSCSAIYNNARKDWANIKTGPIPKSNTKSKNPISKTRKNRSNSSIDAVDPYTRIYLCVCKITGIKWYSPTVKTIHPKAVETKRLYTYQCRFQFSISKYPEWFAESSNLIKEFGWYSAANRGNNLSGCSRDHLYSINDGFKNNIDPKILSHPANCKIVPHRKNQSKNKNSSITLDELLNRIKIFDEKYMESATGIQPV